MLAKETKSELINFEHPVNSVQYKDGKLIVEFCDGYTNEFEVEETIKYLEHNEILGTLHARGFLGIHPRAYIITDYSSDEFDRKLTRVIEGRHAKAMIRYYHDGERHKYVWLFLPLGEKMVLMSEERKDNYENKQISKTVYIYEKGNWSYETYDFEEL